MFVIVCIQEAVDRNHMIDCCRYDSSPECFTVNRSHLVKVEDIFLNMLSQDFYSASLCNNDQVPAPIRSAMFFISFCKRRYKFFVTIKF